MEVWQIILGILGATGFWKLVEILLRYRSDKKVKSAEARNLNASAQKQIVENWVQWSQKLETRVKEFEEHTDELEKIIDKQKEQIKCLEKKVNKMEKERGELVKELHELKKMKQDGQ